MINRRTALVGGFWAGALMRQASAATPVTLAISSNTLAYGGLRIAEGAGLFLKNGLAPRIVVMDSGNAAISAVLGRSAEFSASGPGEVLAAKVRGRDLVIILNIYRGLTGSLVLSKASAAKTGVAPDAPIEQRLRQLNGLSIAQPSATSAYLHPYKAASEAVGAKIKFVYMTQPAMVAALQAGAVDGIVAGAPFSLASITNGSGVLWISGPKDELPEPVRPTSSTCLQTTVEYAKSNPGVIAAMRGVAADLAAFIRDKPDEALAILARAFPSLDVPSAKAAFAENARNWSAPKMTPDDIKREIEIQVSSGSLPGVAAIDPASVLLP
jgi:ABC-type nitrate/sulfonate/bicarbonate transport system substrate-binding protein